MAFSTKRAKSPKSPLSHLSEQQLDELAREFDAIRDRVRADLGERDREYIESLISMHRRLEICGRALLLLAADRRPRWAGALALTAAKILENMEIGHNVLHGQWDWMNDPRIHSSTWDWDLASGTESWKHSHNYLHHTFTNIRGKDRDIGYRVLRIDPRQHWLPRYLLQPFYNLILAAFFEWGIAIHDLDYEGIREGTKSKAELARELALIRQKAKAQVTKDYIAWPLASAATAMAVAAVPELARGIREGQRREGALGRVLRRGLKTYRATAATNATTNVTRNVWLYLIIFCGHFPDQTYTFNRFEVEDETPGAAYVRQLTGSANIEGSPIFHIASGNLGYQVEHHLFPDLPSNRYGEIAPAVKDVCERYELPYNTGPFLKQFLMVQRTILRLSLPGGEPRPKPGPYRRAPAEAAAS